LDATTIPGAITLLFGESVGDPADFAAATETLKGVTELDQVQRGQIVPDACDLFEDFVNDPDEVLDEYRSDHPDKVPSLEELQKHLPEEEALPSKPAPDTGTQTPPAGDSSRRTLGGVSPDAALPGKKAAQLTLEPSGGDTSEKPRRRQLRVGTGTADPPDEVQRPVRPPPSTDLPEATKALLQDPTYRRLVDMHLSAALRDKGQIPTYVDSNLQSIGERRVEVHLRLMWAWVRRNQHRSDTKRFEELFGVTLSTS
jgi:hypothetical protein